MVPAVVLRFVLADPFREHEPSPVGNPADDAAVGDDQGGSGARDPVMREILGDGVSLSGLLRGTMGLDGMS